jgi:hypothetical protein
MAKTYKLGHFSMPPISQEKSHMVPIFGSVQSLMTKGYFFTKQRVDSPHSYETCLFNGRTDGWTDGWMPQNSYLTSSADFVSRAKKSQSSTCLKMAVVRNKVLKHKRLFSGFVLTHHTTRLATIELTTAIYDFSSVSTLFQ